MVEALVDIGDPIPSGTSPQECKEMSVSRVETALDQLKGKGVIRGYRANDGKNISTSLVTFFLRVSGYGEEIPVCVLGQEFGETAFCQENPFLPVVFTKEKGRLISIEKASRLVRGKIDFYQSLNLTQEILRQEREKSLNYIDYGLWREDVRQGYYSD